MQRRTHPRNRFPGLRAAYALGRDAVEGWLEHQASRTGAALAFYTVFSLAPVLLLSIAIAGAFFGEQAASGEIFAQIRDLIGPAGALAVESVLAHARHTGSGLLATLVSVVTLIVGANTALAQLKAGLDEVWSVPVQRRQGFGYFVRTRLLTVGMILALGFLLLVSLVLSAALTALERLTHGGALLEFVLGWLNELLAFGLVTALFATLYRMLPGVALRWRDVVVGAIMTAVLFSLGKSAIGFYVGNSGIASAYGAAGSVIVVLLWVYYSAQIVLLGAEFTRAWAQRYGSRRGRAPPPPLHRM